MYTKHAEQGLVLMKEVNEKFMKTRGATIEPSAEIKCNSLMVQVNELLTELNNHMKEII